MPTLTHTTFGDRLRLVRERLELSQDELGALLGLTARTVRRHEQRGGPPPSSALAEQLAALADLDPEWVRTGAGTEPEPASITSGERRYAEALLAEALAAARQLRARIRAATEELEGALDARP